MWKSFIFENAHFAVNFYTAFTLFFIAWLYADAWSTKKNLAGVLRFTGFLLLSLSFAIHASFVDVSYIRTLFLKPETLDFLMTSIKFSGYILIILSLITEPLQSKTNLIIIPLAGVSIQSDFAFPVLAFLTATLYLRRVIFGLENHLKPVALGFYTLSIYELLSLGVYFRGTQDIDIFRLVSAYGIVWTVEHTVLLIAVIILAKWVFGYLLKRLNSQLMAIFTMSILTIFVVSTVSFTSILLKNIQDEALSQLNSEVKVLNFAIESKKGEALSDAEVFSQNANVRGALKKETGLNLSQAAQEFLLAKKLNSLIVVDNKGQVIARGEDIERIGDSFSDDLIVKRALRGEKISSIIVRDGIIAPEVSVKSSVPVYDQDKVTGAVVIENSIDNSFADGIKKATGLEVSVYAGETLSATTLTSFAGTSRILGIKEKDNKIITPVLLKGENYTGSISLVNTPYFAAYAPLNDVDNQPVGMLFVGKPQVGVLQTAGKSIQLSFVFAAILILISILPSYLISRYISYQLK